MIPPSSAFLCEVMEQYLSISQELGETDSPEYETLCSYFSRIISQNASTFEQYQNLIPFEVQSPVKDVIVRYVKTGGFIGIGRTHSIIFEIPLSLLNVSSNGSEKLITFDDINLTLAIDGVNEYGFNLEELSIETGDSLSTSYMIIKVNNMGKYELNMEKPDKDSGFIHTLEFTVSSTNIYSYFDPISFILIQDSEAYDEIVNRIKYVK